MLKIIEVEVVVKLRIRVNLDQKIEEHRIKQRILPEQILQVRL